MFPRERILLEISSDKFSLIRKPLQLQYHVPARGSRTLKTRLDAWRSRFPSLQSTGTLLETLPPKRVLELFRAYHRRSFRPNELVKLKLMEMGFDEVAVIDALRLSGNDQSQAVSSASIFTFEHGGPRWFSILILKISLHVFVKCNFPFKLIEKRKFKVFQGCRQTEGNWFDNQDTQDKQTSKTRAFPWFEKESVQKNLKKEKKRRAWMSLSTNFRCLLRDNKRTCLSTFE